MNRLLLELGLLLVLFRVGNSQPASAALAGMPSALSNSSFVALRATTLSVGIYHTCAVTSNGSAKCWGDNRDGQLGDGTVAERHIPIEVSGLDSGVANIATGSYFTCALMMSGGVKCWGQNSSGQLGDGTTTYQYTPVDVIGLASQVSSIATGSFHACALMNGGVQCWGDNSAGQLGDNTTTNRNSPVSVNGLSTGVSAISIGMGHSCALTISGGVKCWGDNSYGQLGDGTTVGRLTPVDVIGLGSSASAVAAGDSYTCALMVSGGVKCWGTSLLGQFFVPIEVTGLQSNVIALAAGAGYTCALMNGGTVQCWGINNFGQLGDGTTTNRYATVNVIGLGTGATAIAAGDGHTCALVGLGIKCWGRNFFGELGDNEFLYQTTPVNVIEIGAIGQSAIVDIAAGWLDTCLLTSHYSIACWGFNGGGQLGDGTTTDRTIPVQVIGLTSGVSAMAVGESVTCALLGSGRTKCWGSNGSGQLGDGTTTDRMVPVDVQSHASDYAMISAGYAHVCALTKSGGVQCWGDNSAGQLGDGTTTNRTTPVDVLGLRSGVAQITAGGYHTCALMIDGTIKCWGNNGAGQLGDGTTTSRSKPVSTLGITEHVIAISGGIAHTCALTSGGVKCWGSNWTGQLGDGTMTDRSKPVDVIGLTSGTVKISAGGFITCAVTLSGNAKCWGFNSNGAVGDGTTTARLTPVNVIGLTSGVTQISAGQNHACALTTTSAIKCWGFNYYGQLGNGESGHRTTPVGVLLFQNYAPILLRNQ